MLLLHWYLTENQKGPFRTTINCYQLLQVTLILLAFRLLFLKGNRYMTNYKKKPKVSLEVIKAALLIHLLFHSTAERKCFQSTVFSTVNRPSWNNTLFLLRR